MRHELLPLLERDYNPALAEVLSGTAEIARAEEQYWEQFALDFWGASACLPPDEQRRTRVVRFDHEHFCRLTVAEQRRALAFLLSQVCAMDFKHVEAARYAVFAAESTSLPDGWDLRVSAGELHLSKRGERD